MWLEIYKRRRTTFLVGLEVLENFSESFNPRIYADDCNARRQNCMYWWRRGRVELRSSIIAAKLYPVTV
jgi:hypothetical protein